MYIFAVAFFMFIFPLASIVLEVLINKNPASAVDLVGKWFVFWAIGVRLFTACLRQIAKPELTSEGILGIKGKEARVLVRELGFANVAIGLVGLISLWHTQWQSAGALAGGLFLLLAGLTHSKNKQRNFEENIAMISDLAIGLLMLFLVLNILT